jgi:ATP-dependent DNA helicase RecG
VDASPLEQSVTILRGVGPVRREQLDRLSIRTLRDLLAHFPFRYENFADVRTVSRLTADGALQTVQGEVVNIETGRLSDGRPTVRITLQDDLGEELHGVWFQQTYATRRYRFGQRLAFSGRPRRFRDEWSMANPRVQVLDGSEDNPGLVPVYPLTEELRTDHLRPLLRQAVDQYAAHWPDILPVALKRKHGLPNAARGLVEVHFPDSLEQARTARRRFVYEEFLLLQLALGLRRRELRDRQQAPSLTTSPAIDARIRRLFPFQLTADQDRAVSDICRDLASDRPMQRLLQADVGAGKTAVAVYAMLVTVANKHQAVMMAPTEVLVQQHWRTLERALAESRVRRLLLTGALTPKSRRLALERIRSGEVDLVVGTQALVQEDVQFARLGLVVIDEQHKFGVAQRARVRRLGLDPHYLVMTATPIPRTTALTVFGDLDVSVIKQLPPDRQPVRTRWLAEANRERLYKHLAEELKGGRQGYVVCPQVSETEATGDRPPKSAEQTASELREGAFRDFRLGLLHGRLDDAKKDEIMEWFRRHELDLLVSTVVIEVGVDVPNATLMVIEDADRFGLSQLHQLRGRVSRGTVAGQCYLFAEKVNDEARERLLALTRTTDGFALAELDAHLRGAGQFFGTRQHGLGELWLGDLQADRELLRTARRDAFQLVAGDARLQKEEHTPLRHAVLAKYGRTLDLAEIG